MAEQEEEFRLARTAAPPHVSNDATVYVLTRDGYELAEEGANSFTCLVFRGFTGSLANPDFWNPDVRGPVCYNEAAARSALPADRLRTQLALAGRTKNELAAAQAEAFRTGKLLPPGAGAMAFMQSPEQFLGATTGRSRPHLMIYLLYGRYEEWGASATGAPAIPFDGDGEPLTTLIIPLPAWSDGAAAPTP